MLRLFHKNIHYRKRLNLFNANTIGWIALLLLAVVAAATANAQTVGNYVPSGAQVANHGSIALHSGSATWLTERAATPGYFTLYGGATFSGAANNSTALIDGYVRHIATMANQGATYPVGQGTVLRTLTTSGTIPNGMDVATAWISGDPSANLDPTSTGAAGGAHAVTARGAGIYAVSTVGQWDWQDFNNTASGATVTVTTPNLSGFGAANVLRLVGWNGTQWVNLSAAQGKDAATGNTEGSTLSGTIQSGISAIALGRVTIVVNIKVFLQGAYNAGTGLMRTTLNTRGLIPLNQPYNRSPFSYTGTESVSSIPANVTDWVLVELRNSSNALVERRAAFLKNDGTVVDLDGTTLLQFPNQPEGSYHVAVVHRNHLRIRTPNVLTVNDMTPIYDYTTAQTRAFQNPAITSNAAMRFITGTNAAFVMWAGDGTKNGFVNYSVLGNDEVFLKTALSNNTGSQLINVYHDADYNMDGNVNYSVLGNDQVFLKNVLLNNTSNSFRSHQ